MEDILNSPSLDSKYLTLHQKLEDPREVRIRKVLYDTIFSTPDSVDKFQEIKYTLIRLFNKYNYLSKQISNLEYINLLKEVGVLLDTNIISGKQYLQSLQSSKPRGIIIITNHIGIAKLCCLHNYNTEPFYSQLGFDEPFPPRYASIFTIAEILNRPLIEVAGRQPSPLDFFQDIAQTITFNYDGVGELPNIIKKVSLVLEDRRYPIIIMYPERGTSGKRNLGSMYDLEEFRSGPWIIAKHFKIPMIPICQFYSIKSGLSLGILEPILFSEDATIESMRLKMTNTKKNMQDFLKSCEYMSRSHRNYIYL